MKAVFDVSFYLIECARENKSSLYVRMVGLVTSLVSLAHTNTHT